MTGATSVVDLGCGTGSWLATVREHGVTDASASMVTTSIARALEIPPEQFFAADLTEPLPLDRTFDLAISVEVAEHLPEDAAEVFVGSLARLAPVVAFSAAIPAQGGTGHINLQWQAYWAERFARCGYVPVDYIRPRVWSEPGVRYFYAQNLIVYVRESELSRYEGFDAAVAPLDIVHPRCTAICCAGFPRQQGCARAISRGIWLAGFCAARRADRRRR